MNGKSKLDVYGEFLGDISPFKLTESSHQTKLDSFSIDNLDLSTNQLISQLVNKLNSSPISKRNRKSPLHKEEPVYKRFERYQEQQRTNLAALKETYSPEKPFHSLSNKKIKKTSKRLSQPRKTPPRDMAKEFSFQPQIDSKSALIDKKNKSTGKRWERLSITPIPKEKTREEDMSECTFKPSILKPSSQADPEALVNRLHGWELLKYQKLQRNMEHDISIEQELCTFSPKINSKVNKKPANLSLVKGFDLFMKRSSQKYSRRALELRSNSPAVKLKPKLQPSLDMRAVRSALHTKLLSLFHN